MPTPFEAEIHALLRDLKDPQSVADDLMRRWNLNLLNEGEKTDCAQFMLASGQYAMLFNQLIRAIEQKSSIPWAQFAEAIGSIKLRPKAEDIDALITGAREQGRASILVRSHKLDLWSRKLLEIRASIQNERASEIEVQKKELQERLEFVRAQRLEQEEEKILNEMQALFPSENNVNKEREAFEVRRARGVVAKSSDGRDWEMYLERNSERLSDEQAAVRDLIVERAAEMVTENPKQAYDLAMHLHFMGFHQAALDILNAGKSDAPSTDWFRLELLIDARRFIDVLEETTRLETVYSGDPESSFAAAYARARALKGLGRNEDAIDLLRGLVAVRPYYKSAHSLLMDWSGGEE